MPAYRDPFGDGSPGPYLTVRVSWKDNYRDILALLDTGADITQIPDVVAEILRLEQIDVVTVSSAHNDERDKPLCVANLDIGGIQFPAFPVVADSYPIALIGRDVLNELNALFEGPAQQFVLNRP
jgi:predicted aspartyl protease